MGEGAKGADSPIAAWCTRPSVHHHLFSVGAYLTPSCTKLKLAFRRSAAEKCGAIWARSIVDTPSPLARKVIPMYMQHLCTNWPNWPNDRYYSRAAASRPRGERVSKCPKLGRCYCEELRA